MKKVSSKKEFIPINLPKDLVEDLKLYRKAFSICYANSDVTYEFMIRQLLAGLEDSDPGVYEEYCHIYEKAHPEMFSD